MTSTSDEIEMFKELLRFRTVNLESPESLSYRECCEWLVRTVNTLIPIAETTVIEIVKGKPIVVAKITGRDPSLEAVCLNAHYDVVPAIDECWTVDPWTGVVKDGKIYGRGTQDMKSVAIQYILALGRIYRNSNGNLEGDPKPLFKRNVFLSFVPDEEIGGQDGMAAFISSGEFDRLIPNVGIVLDEGLANPEKGKNTVFYGERTPLWIKVRCEGPTGHGSRFIKDTATEKLVRVAYQAFDKRREQQQLIGLDSGTGCKHCRFKDLGDVLTINLTAFQAGVKSGDNYLHNVIPTEAIAAFDIRVPLTMPFDEVKKMLDEWTAEDGVTWEVDSRGLPFDSDKHEYSCTYPENNKYWNAFFEACERGCLEIVPRVFPAATDSRFLRRKGICAFGFSPMSGTPILMHDHDEYIEVDTFTKGIEIYETYIIPAIANVD